MLNRKNLEKGFTLIELIVVIAVLAILAGVAIPKFVDVTNQAKIAAEKADVGTIRAGITSAAMQVNAGVVTIAYPSDLAFEAGPPARAFTNILEANAQLDFAERGWTKTGAVYTGPNGGTYSYTATGAGVAGQFLKTN